MSVALTYSVAGMQAAQDRLAIRARNVANVQTPGYKAAEVVQEATASGPVVSERLPVDTVTGDDVAGGESDLQYRLPFDELPQDSPRAPSQDDPQAPSDVSLDYELTDMILAKHAYKASASVVRTVGEMQDSLLDIFI